MDFQTQAITVASDVFRVQLSQLFDDKTEFLSAEALDLFDGLLSICFLTPLLISLYNLRTASKSPHATPVELLSQGLAVVSVVLRLTAIFLIGAVPTPLQWVSLAIGAVVAWVQSEQIGKVRVCESSLLLYWFAQVFVATSFTVDAALSREIGLTVVWAALVLVSVVVLAAESTSSAHHSPEVVDGNGRKRRVPSFDSVSVFQRISLSFIEPVLHHGLKNSIEREDVPLPPVGLNAANSYASLELALSSRLGRYRVARSVVSIVRSWIVLEIFLDSVGELLRLSQPLILSQFLKALGASVADPSISIFPAFYFGALNAAVPLVATAFASIGGLVSASVEVRASNSLQGAIYRKSMHLSPKSREEFDTGKIMNMLNVDAGNVHQLGYMVKTAVVTPIVFVLAVYQLYKLVGLVMFSAAIVLAILSVLTGWGSAMIVPIFPRYMQAKDERSQATINAFRNIRSIKLYSWEKAFYDKISTLRVTREVAEIVKFFRISAPVTGLWAITDELCAVTMFTTFLYFGVGNLTADIVFPALTLFQIIAGAAGSIPQLIPWVSKLLNSDKRINELLTAEELSSANYFRDMFASGSDVARGVVSASNATIGWTGEDADDKIAIRDLTLKAVPGEFMCIIGQVGSGKTAILKAIAGQLVIMSGSISVDGTIAYCGQEPWLQNGSVKSNVCFGKRLEESWYKRVMDACELTVDVDKMPNGHETEVGERGITLSGGQKARLALARAVYSRADIYLLDDVLSAVDEHVAKHLIDNLFSAEKGLLAGNTVILATNYIKVLKHASCIVSIQNKSVLEEVSLKEMLARKSESPTYRLLSEFGVGGAAEVDKLEPHDRDTYVKRRTESALRLTTPGDKDFIAGPPPMLISGEELVNQRKIDTENDDKDETTAASLSVIGRYLETVNKFTIVFGLALTVLSITFTNLLSIWIGVISNHGFNNLPDARWYVIIYVCLAVLCGVSLFSGVAWFTTVVAPKAATVLHDRMLWSVLRAPMSYFDTTPIGKILNRFTGDLDALNIGFPMTLYAFFRAVLNLIVSFAITVGGTPLTLVAIVPMLYFAIKFRNLYVPASRQVTRMSQAAESPILSHIEESLKGATVVKTFDRLSQFEHVYDARVDYANELEFLSQSISGWLSWRITCFTQLVGFTAAMSATTLAGNGKLTVGAVGVVLYMATRSGMLVGSLIDQSASVEVNCVALERVVEMTNLPQEAPEHIPDSLPDGPWPVDGRVAFENYSCRYSPAGEDVLKKISFAVKGGEKIGVVGRTGSGKSTLTMALFRILEASNGHVAIDDVNTSTIGLHDLREHLGIIPQDSQIFKGTVRDNLDPFHTSGDARLWEILEFCHLKEHFSALETGLETEINDGGENLSRGQTQLICLGRALLHDSKILVLDEATASVDVETDHILQQTIRSQFKERTIITVAHRLNTIMDSSRVLVLDDGEIVEFDTPEVLLANKGAFYGLCNAQKNTESK